MVVFVKGHYKNLNMLAFVDRTAQSSFGDYLGVFLNQIVMVNARLLMLVMSITLMLRIRRSKRT